MNDHLDDWGRVERRREASLTMFGAFMVGLVLIAVAGRLVHLGPAVGTALLVALPLVAASAGASRLRRDR